MSDDETQLDVHRLANEWYTNYDRAFEYEKNPLWVGETHLSEDGEGTAVLYDRERREDIWIQSDRVYNLMNCL